jgi:hypothetical protein
MPVCIIDFRDERRNWLSMELQARGHAVTQVACVGGDHAPNADLVLLHVGGDQEELETGFGSSIERLLNSYQDVGCVVLCFFGGSPADVARRCAFPNVAVYPAAVDSYNPDTDFLRTVMAVLGNLAHREALPPDWFRSLVNGFDPILEARLEVLVAVLKGADVPEGRLNLLRSKCPGAFSEGRLVCDGTPKSVDRLRKILFNEDPWERSA